MRPWSASGASAGRGHPDPPGDAGSLRLSAGGSACGAFATPREITPAAITGVASFYDMFRHKPVGKHIVRVCRGTACHVTGAERVEDALRRQLQHSRRATTPIPTGEFTIEQVACLGCCTLAPVVRIGEHTFGHATAEKVGGMIRDFTEQQRQTAASAPPPRNCTPAQRAAAQINIGLGSCCMAKGSDQLFHALRESVARDRRRCGGQTRRLRRHVPSHADDRGRRSRASRARSTPGWMPPTRGTWCCAISGRAGLTQRVARLWTSRAGSLPARGSREHRLTDVEMSMREPDVSAFLGRQVHIATEQFGKVDPLDLDEYLSAWRISGAGALPAGVGCVPATSGNAADCTAAGASRSSHQSRRCAAQLLTPAHAEQIIEIIEQSGLRGRGGAGFPTAHEMAAGAQAAGETEIRHLQRRRRRSRRVHGPHAAGVFPLPHHRRDGDCGGGGRRARRHLLHPPRVSRWR